MLVVNRGASGSLYIFRGSEAERFIGPLFVTAHWPVAFKLKGHPIEKGQLFETRGGTFFLTVNNENLPDLAARALFKHAMAAMKTSEEKHNATD